MGEGALYVCFCEAHGEVEGLGFFCLRDKGYRGKVGVFEMDGYGCG